MNLNPEQERAVSFGGGPLLILAGAGSGKTRVLTSRIAHLITEKGVEPNRILAMTFTNKAAGEMKTRIEKMVGLPPSSLWVSTFHSFCLRVLRKYAVRLGYKDNFIVFDSKDQAALLKRCLKELNISEDTIAPKAAVSRISRAKDDFISAEAYKKNATDFWAEKFSNLYSLYHTQLIAQNAMDFGDLLLNTMLLFNREPGILARYQSNFQHILVDEYQDTNKVQYLLVKALAAGHSNIVVVGDEDQSIYGWRGATIRNILEFKQDFPGAEIVRLEQNYRSTPTILNAAHSVIINNETRIGKKLWTDLPDKELVTVAHLFDGLDESKYIAGEIKKWMQEGRRLDDMAIFYRTNAQSRLFEECFRNFGIPYVIYGGMKFYERMEIKDILAYLKFILVRESDMCLLRILNVPTRGIGKTTVEKVRALARQDGLSLWDAASKSVYEGLLGGQALKKVREFLGLINKLRDELETLSLGDFTRHLVEATGYLASHKSKDAPDSTERIENIQEFIRATSEFKEVASVGLPQFLDQVALVSDIDGMDQGKGVIPLMTLHLSKGLEFPLVFMVGMEEGLFPHSNSMDNDDELEEERRLCYVGMTRAKEKLYMTCTGKRYLHGREQYNLPSRFLAEIDSAFVDIQRAGRSPFVQRPSNPQNSQTNFSAVASYEAVDDFDQRPPEELESSLRIGTKVRHPMFGEGVIRKIEGSGDNQKVIVQFSSGKIKTLVIKYAQLEILP